MLWMIIVILFLFWIAGFAVHLGGDLIHFLLIIALVGVIYQLFFKGKSRL